MDNIQNNKKNNKKYKTYVIVFFISLIIVILILLNIYRCPLKVLIGLPCPFCGMTRALISALTLDFNQAFYYHALWPLMLLLPIYLILRIKGIKINNKLENIICIIIAIMFIVYYIYRHITLSPIVEIHYEKSIVYSIIEFIKNN